jgi:hypothetical protein
MKSITLPTLNAGEAYAGIILEDGEPSHHLILLPGEIENATWKDAMEWAAEHGGELPARREQSLLYANLKEQFKETWYWSSEEHASDSDCAWTQHFGGGNQAWNDKGNEFRARAVRRVKIGEVK